MTDPITGLSRGYGFVRFLNQMEQHDAVMEMNGIICSNRPMRVSYATPKNNSARYLQLALQAPALVQQPTDPNNTTVFVGGLSSPVNEEELRQYFAPFGEVTYVKIPSGKGCGFVQYVSRPSAELAIERMNGFLIGNSRIRLSWGRSQADKMISSPPMHNTTLQPSLGSPQPTTFATSNDYIRPFIDPTSPTTSSHILGSFRPLSPPNSLYQQHQDSMLFRPDSSWFLKSEQQEKDDWHFSGIHA
jgi:RNA recognition motif-containing protein